MRGVPGLAVVALLLAGVPASADPLKVTMDGDGVIRIDGKKFLPVAVWAQPEDTFAMWKDLGINLFITSSNPRAGKTVADYLKAAEENKVYVSIGYRWAVREGKLDEVMKHPLVFTLHHNDEPDKPRMASDAVIDKGPSMRVNSGRPLFTMLDGNLRSSAVIDPPQGVEFSIRLPKPVTVGKLALAVEAGTYATPKEVEFVGDGKSLLKATVEKKAGLQEFPLPAAAAFSALTVRVLSAYESDRGYGAICEVQGLDAEGKNQLLFPSRLTAAGTPEEVMADYKAIKAVDSARLVSLCIMARFMPEVGFQKIPMEMYRQYPPATDLLMFDLYPTSVWPGKNLHWNALGLDQLRQLAGPGKALGIWLQASNAMNPRDPGMTPEQMRADTWLALIHGATFIGYFPQTFNPGFKFHDINAERRAALRSVVGEITTLTDLILSPPRNDLFTVAADGSRVDVLQREDGGKGLLVLVNVVESGSGAPATVTIAPKGFKAVSLVNRDTKTPLPADEKSGGWTLELKPWETVVLTAERQR